MSFSRFWLRTRKERRSWTAQNNDKRKRKGHGGEQPWIAKVCLVKAWNLLSRKDCCFNILWIHRVYIYIIYSNSHFYTSCNYHACLWDMPLEEHSLWCLMVNISALHTMFVVPPLKGLQPMVTRPRYQPNIADNVLREAPFLAENLLDAWHCWTLSRGSWMLFFFVTLGC